MSNYERFRKYRHLQWGGKRRVLYLDALKCLGILLVIEGHVKLMGMGIDDTYKNASSLMLYSFNMPIFFFVSGLLAFKMNDISSLECLSKLKNKFLFLVLPALAFSLCYKMYAHENIVEIFTKGFGRYWFTFTLFEVFVLYYISIAISRSKQILTLILVILSALGIGYLCFFSSYDIGLLDLNHLAKYFQFFAIGVLASMNFPYYERVMRSEIVNFLTIAGFFVLLALLFYDSMPSIVYHFLRDVVLRWLGTFVVISWFYNHSHAFEKETLINGWILRIGQNSLAIYLLQYFFLPNLKGFTDFVASLDVFSIHVLAILYTFVITTVCMLLIELLSNSGFVRKYILGKN